MSSDGEALDFEASAAALARQQDVFVARIHSALQEPGADDCIDCEGPIGAKRRAAMPSARRCIGCQTKFENGGMRGS